MYDTNNRILIIDDNEAIHDDFARLLAGSSGDDLDWIRTELLAEEAAEPEEDDGFELSSAFQGREAYEQLIEAKSSGRRYAMAFVDIRMPPGWDGLETIEHLWEVDPDLEVVICSAYSDYDWNEITERLGKTDRLLILKKPFEPMEVTQLAHALTQKWRLRQTATMREAELQQLVEERTRELRALNERLKQEIAERERVEAELRLAQRLEAVGHLAAGIAHEINTPMQYIGDNTHFLMTAFDEFRSAFDEYQRLFRSHGIEPPSIDELDYVRETIPDALESALDGVNTVRDIVRALKDFAQPTPTHKIATDVNRILEATITVSRNQWRSVADVTCGLDPNLPDIPALPDELSQVFLNVLMNAVQAIEDGPRSGRGAIEVSTRRVESGVEVQVTDAGVGIPDDDLACVFDPFFTTREVGRGMGQGLSISRSIIVDKHGGALTVESTLGEGTTVTIRLPLEASSNVEPEEPPRTLEDVSPRMSP